MIEPIHTIDAYYNGTGNEPAAKNFLFPSRSLRPADAISAAARSGRTYMMSSHVDGWGMVCVLSRVNISLKYFL